MFTEPTALVSQLHVQMQLKVTLKKLEATLTIPSRKIPLFIVALIHSLGYNRVGNNKKQDNGTGGELLVKSSSCGFNHPSSSFLSCKDLVQETRGKGQGTGLRNKIKDQETGSRYGTKKLRSGNMIKDLVSNMKDQGTGSNLLVSLLRAASPPFAEHLPHHSPTRIRGCQNSGT